MLTLRPDQLQSLEQDRILSFELEMSEHARAFSPRHCEILGQSGVRAVVQLAMQRSQRHGFTYRGPIRLFLELVFMLGSDFDTDPLFPWAAEILADRKIPDQMGRADRLYHRSGEYFDETAGPKSLLARRALHALGRAREESLPVGGSTFATAMIARFERIYPEKCRYVGEPALRKMVERAVQMASELNLGTDAGAVLVSALTFTVGHGFASDPCLPWIKKTLDDPKTTDPAERVARLWSRCSIYLDRALEHLEKG